MSILNRTNDGLHNVLIVLCGALQKEGRVERDKLIQICSNKDENSIKQVRQTLLRWTQLGLFVEDGSEIYFSQKIGEYKKNEILKNLPIICRKIIFSQENNKNFWDSEKAKSADISRALSWIMAQDVYDFSLQNYQLVEKMESIQLIDDGKRLFQNDTRLPGLRDWARFLGFSCVIKNFLVDPTAAIRQEAEILFERNTEYAVNEFLGEIVVKLPILDGGAYRKRVEEVLDTQHWDMPSNPQMLSTSLSRALWRLELAGILDLVTRSDAEANRLIQRQGARQLKSFTHVVYRGKGR